MPQFRKPLRKPRGFVVFALIILGLVVLDAALGVVTFPLKWDPFVSPLITAIYVVAPIWALYEASREKWTWTTAVLLIVIGVAIHCLILVPLAPARNLTQIAWMRAFEGFAQAGLLTWCLGLGALLATLLRDRNLLLPVAIFLAAFDIFVILTPGGPTRQLMTAHPEAFAKIAFSIPRASFAGAEVGSGITARIGPADMFLLAMFFVALTRFGMRAAATFRAVAPALLLYLLVVIVFGRFRIGPIRLDALPALVPIGAVILIVNRKEFNLTRDEKLSTAVVSAIGVGLIIFGATRHRPEAQPEAQAGPSQREGAPRRGRRGALRAPAAPGQPQSDSRSAPAGTPSPQ